MWSEDHKQSDSFTHFRAIGHNRFIYDTKTRYVDEKDFSNPTKVAMFGWIHLKVSILRGLKVMSTTFVLNCFLKLNESTFQTRKNIFYFTSKALFVLEKIKF